MKKSTNKDSPRRKLVLRREAIALLTGSALGDVRGGVVDDSTTDRTRPPEDPGGFRSVSL